MWDVGLLVGGLALVVVGLTVVSIGTGMPEVTTSLIAAWSGHGDVALGNLVGSNIFNALLILGVVAIVAPIPVALRLVRLDVPVLLVVSLVVLLMGLDGALGRWEGLLLLAGFTVHLGLSLAGIALLVVGSRWAVFAAIDIARRLGMSELVIGLTIIAAGTGLPEVVTSAVAARRGEPDIAVGNVIGSNLVNLLLVLGLVTAVVPGGVPVARQALRFDLPIMVVSAFGR